VNSVTGRRRGLNFVVTSLCKSIKSEISRRIALEGKQEREIKKVKINRSIDVVKRVKERFKVIFIKINRIKIFFIFL